MILIYRSKFYFLYNLMQKQITRWVAILVALIILWLSFEYNKLHNQAKNLEQENNKIKKETCYDLHIQKNRNKLAHENIIDDLIIQYGEAGKKEAMQKRKKNISEEEMTAVYNQIDATETKIKELEQKSHEIRQQIASCE